jgi:hypothetical protein
MTSALLDCGFRRAEVAGLGVQDLQQREEHWVFADLIGKDGHCEDGPPSVLDCSGGAHLDGGGKQYRWPDLPRDQQSRTDWVSRLQYQGHLGRGEAGLRGLQPRQRRT